MSESETTPRIQKRANSYDPSWPRNESGRWTRRTQPDTAVPWIKIPSGTGSPVSVPESAASVDIAAVRARARASSRASSVASNGKKPPSIPENETVEQSLSPKVPVYEANGSVLSQKPLYEDGSILSRQEFDMTLNDTPPRAGESLMDEMQREQDEQFSNVSRSSSFERRIAAGLLGESHSAEAGRLQQMSVDMPALPMPIQEVPTSAYAKPSQSATAAETAHTAATTVTVSNF